MPIKVYAAAVSSCQKGCRNRKLVFRHSLVKRFLQGLRRQQLLMCASQGEVLLVLKTLVKGPYKLELELELSLKTVLLLGLTSPKRVYELSTLSVHPRCMLHDHSGVTL